MYILAAPLVDINGIRYHKQYTTQSDLNCFNETDYMHVYFLKTARGLLYNCVTDQRSA